MDKIVVDGDDIIIPQAKFPSLENCLQYLYNRDHGVRHDGGVCLDICDVIAEFVLYHHLEKIADVGVYTKRAEDWEARRTRDGIVFSFYNLYKSPRIDEVLKALDFLTKLRNHEDVSPLIVAILCIVRKLTW